MFAKNSTFSARQPKINVFLHYPFINKHCINKNKTSRAQTAISAFFIFFGIGGGPIRGFLGAVQKEGVIEAF